MITFYLFIIIKKLENLENKIDWDNLCLNPNAIDILKRKSR